MMYLKKIIPIFLIVLLASCTEKQSREPETEQLSDSASKEKYNIEALFDQAPGEELFKAGCITCHSLRYIEMQPPFPRKTWVKIVDKMIKNFGAPIPDSSAKVIVDYLVSIKGKQ
ncbi:MAG: cytochrome c [Bacteroidota bacterium]